MLFEQLDPALMSVLWWGARASDRILYLAMLKGVAVGERMAHG